MIEPVIEALAGIFLALAVLGVAYLVAAAPPATILKPLRGAEPELLQNLASFRRQDYPIHQLVLGVAEASDAAVPWVERLIAAEPGADIRLVVDARAHGRNRKVSNLINMLEAARHPILVVSDSDMRVGPDYLAQIVGPLGDPGVGIVTCLYVGKPVGGLWSHLGAAFINHQFLPMALLGRLLGESKGCFGATMAFRRADLEKAGGFEPIADLLADDHALGGLMRGLGKRVHLSRYLIVDMVHEPSLAQLFAHELRWARTIRTLAPASHLGTLVTHPLALAVIAVLFAWDTPLALPALAVLAAALAVRLAGVRLIDRALGLEPAPLRNVPLRDMLSFVVWCASFWGKSVRWRGQAFRVAADGRLV